MSVVQTERRLDHEVQEERRNLGTCGGVNKEGELPQDKG